MSENIVHLLKTLFSLNSKEFLETKILFCFTVILYSTFSPCNALNVFKAV